MTMRKGGWLVAAAVAVTLAACGSSSSGDGGTGGTTGPTGPTGSTGPTGTTGASTVTGVVTDIGTGAPLAGVTVSGGGQTATTDARGTYTLSSLPAGAVRVSFTKAGYAPGYANATAGSAADSLATRLKQEGTPQGYVATEARTLSQRTEAGPYAVIFTPNSLDTSDTNLTVSITPLDPTKEAAALPGSLVSGGSSPSILVPVTFAEFTILDSAGRRVNLKSSASAIVELPIPPSLRASYPAGTKIHCYSYDAATGKWEDFVEGTVQTSSVDGTSPVLSASIRHFSWYGGAPQGNNCADVYVKVVSAVDGRPLGNARVEASPGTTAYTDANGIARVVAAVGNGSSSYTAYQTGYDVDGSLTGMPGAKYIEFGKVDEELVGLVPRSCSGSGLRPEPMATRGVISRAVRGTASDPLTIRIGVVRAFYEVQAVMMTSGSGSVVSVQVQQGVPAPDGSLDNPIPADGAKVYVGETGATPVELTSAGSGSGYYFSSSLVLTPGKEYTLSVDADGNGSIDGTGKAFAVGNPTWVSPAEGGTVQAASFVASWTDSGVAAGGTAYAPVYYAILSGAGDYASYVGTDRSFSPRSLLSTSTPPAPLAPGAYSGTLYVFSGPFSAAGGNFTTTNNVTGQGVTGQFMSFASAPTVSFNLQ